MKIRNPKKSLTSFGEYRFYLDSIKFIENVKLVMLKLTLFIIIKDLLTILKLTIAI